MAKAVLISIRPEWVEKIAGDRKRWKLGEPGQNSNRPSNAIFIAQRVKKDSDRLWVLREQIRKKYDGLTAVCAHLRAQPDLHSVGNGYVVGEFTCDNIATYNYDYCPHPEIGMDYDCGDSWWEIDDEDLKSACLAEKEFQYYAFGREAMYGWHISDLKIYDDPKQLNRFKPWNQECKYNDLGFAIPNCGTCQDCIVKKPPQSWCYVGELKPEGAGR